MIENIFTGRRPAATVVAVLLLTASVSGAVAMTALAGTPQAAAAPADAAQDLQRRVQEYLDLRATLLKKLQPLSLTPSATEVALRQQRLAEGLRAARASARPGDLIPAAVADQIRATVIADFNRRTAAEERATFSEVADAPIPTINRTYPADAALPTVPPLLLQALPRLPDSLQYRFYGRHIVVLDGDAQIIVDYIANVLPAH